MLNNNNTTSVGTWFWSLLILCIPIVGIVMLFVWAFGGTSDARQNFARASLLWFLIPIAIGVFLMVISLIGLTCVPWIN